MLVLFETPSGHALFKVVDEAAVAAAAESGSGALEATPGALSSVLKLAAFSRFTDTTAALASATALVEGKASKDLRKFLKKHATGGADKLAVGDAKLGASIREKLGVPCVADAASLTLMRAIRANLGDLLGGADAPDGDKGGGGGGGDTDDGRAMALGLAHSLSRYKLKFSPDKVDVMVVQAIGLLDELDKQVNTYGTPGLPTPADDGDVGARMRRDKETTTPPQPVRPTNVRRTTLRGRRPARSLRIKRRRRRRSPPHPP